MGGGEGGAEFTKQICTIFHFCKLDSGRRRERRERVRKGERRGEGEGEKGGERER